jgi:hypothetical protein
MCWRPGDIEAKVVYYSSPGRKVRPFRHGKSLMHLYCGCTIQPSGKRWLERAWPLESIRAATWQSLLEAIVAKGLAER